MKHITYSIIIIALFVIGAAAQKTIRTSQVNLWEGPKVSFIGTENAVGVYDKVNDQCWGNSFVVNGVDGTFSNHLSISMDYVNGSPNPDLGNQIVSGTWTMVVYKDSSYAGVIFGDIIAGEILWVTEPKTGEFVSRTAAASLRILGGMDNFGGYPVNDKTYAFSATTQLNTKKKVTFASIDRMF